MDTVQTRNELDAVEEAFQEWLAKSPSIEELINLQDMEEMNKWGEVENLITCTEPF